MKKLIGLSVVLGLGLSACTANKVGPTLSSNHKKIGNLDAVANEFIFSGDKVVVQEKLKELKLQAQYFNIAENSYQVRYKGEVSYDDIAAKIEDIVNYVEPNYKVNVDYSMNRQEWPSDRYFFKQWGFNNIGQSAPFGLSGTRGSDLGIIEAWATTKGSEDIIVAVIDTGVDYTHPDLRDNMWVNSKEAPVNGGVPGIDDDENGYVDDVYGYDFTSGERTSLHYGIPGDPDPMDESGHGTHCAGTIGAVGENDIGVVGVAQNVKIMAIRGLGKGGGSNADLARAIRYATKNKANVMSNSWGGGNGSKLIREEIRKANEAGIVFVAAAGNDGSNTDVKKHFPSSFDKDEYDQPLNNIISVGASDNNDNPANFSNYGHRSVDVFAPGVDIISTIPTSLSKGKPPYAVYSGTSMATPHVSGVIALMMANRSELLNQPEKVRDILISTSDEKPSLIGKSVSNGRVNVVRALNVDTNKDIKPNWISQSKVITQSGFTEELVDVRHEIKVEDASAIRVHFDRIQVQAPYDSVYLYDKNWRLVTAVEDVETVNYWSATVPGDTVYVRYTNANVKQIQLTLVVESSANSCASKGAADSFPAGDKYMCSVDSKDSSGESGTKIFNTFNSEGFSIDRIEYIKKNEQTVAVQ